MKKPFVNIQTELIMKIGIISDTHDHIPNAEKAAGLFRVQGIRTILHAGDLCSPFMILPFKGFDLHCVFGNNDGDHLRILKKLAEINGNHHGEFAGLTMGGKRIAIYHGTQPDITSALIKCGSWDLVIAGHTHGSEIRMEGSTTFVNPGSAHGFGKHPTVAIYDTRSNDIQIVEL